MNRTVLNKLEKMSGLEFVEHDGAYRAPMGGGTEFHIFFQEAQKTPETEQFPAVDIPEKWICSPPKWVDILGIRMQYGEGETAEDALAHCLEQGKEALDKYKRLTSVLEHWGRAREVCTRCGKPLGSVFSADARGENKICGRCAVEVEDDAQEAEADTRG